MKTYQIALICFILGLALKGCAAEQECNKYGEVVLFSSKTYVCEERKK